eukprot:CAMPEP_0171113014 /NCGR_PEP_ID=MMETSP0766_2-20121228/81028_1 /TAXON_ID=439317 /ORGANISM="Gambierdiscus australes, Strain CAWD 149" /LENGTH=71 /DNA_ID=CAMNT_0011575185 /DNA_START=14 /DNA_END=226 /DNA_ORIENTATION=+
MRAGPGQALLGAERLNSIPGLLEGSVAVGLEVDAWEFLVDELADLVRGLILDELLVCHLASVLLDVMRAGP